MKGNCILYYYYYYYVYKLVIAYCIVLYLMIDYALKYQINVYNNIISNYSI